jgi:hypothetical protein
VTSIVALLTDDAWLTMPPVPLETRAAIWSPGSCR